MTAVRAGPPSPAPSGAREEVVLLDEQGRATGVADKADVHHEDTPLHLAFSCYVLDREGRFLLTRRALGKRTFPGVWTNSCCGHPAAGERLTDAVRRRAREELGIGLRELRLVLPAFRYRAVAADGVTENEMCPVLTARTDEPVVADPAEVAAYEWVDWATFRGSVLRGEREVSSWCREQVALLPAELWTVEARADLLPPAVPR